MINLLPVSLSGACSTGPAVSSVYLTYFLHVGSCHSLKSCFVSGGSRVFLGAERRHFHSFRPYSCPGIIVSFCSSLGYILKIAIVDCSRRTRFWLAGDGFDSAGPATISTSLSLTANSCHCRIFDDWIMSTLVLAHILESENAGETSTPTTGWSCWVTAPASGIDTDAPRSAIVDSCTFSTAPMILTISVLSFDFLVLFQNWIRYYSSPNSIISNSSSLLGRCLQLDVGILCLDSGFRSILAWQALFQVQFLIFICHDPLSSIVTHIPQSITSILAYFPISSQVHWFYLASITLAVLQELEALEPKDFLWRRCWRLHIEIE